MILILKAGKRKGLVDCARHEKCCGKATLQFVNSIMYDL